MGKSPAKWFKAVLFGKKASKSNFSKGKEIAKYANEKTTPVPNKEPAASFPVDQPLISEPLPCPTAGGKQNPDSEKIQTARLPNIGLILSSSKQDEGVQSAADLGPPEDSNRMKLEQAATKAQAAFRGYLARRAFRTLQGIIRLQAVIRSRLVRRQAVATLYCVQGLVKFQSLVRGHMVRGSDIGIEVCSKSNLEKQAAKHMESCESSTLDRVQKSLKNAFVGRLFSMSPTVMPLRLQYGPEEPNSAWNWLLRWTVSHVWEPQSEPKADISSKNQGVQTAQPRAKLSGRRMQSTNVENGINHPTSNSEKTKRKPRGLLDHSANSTLGQQQNGIEKVKHSLKKGSQFTKDTSVEVEVDGEQPRQNHRKSQNLPTPEHLEQSTETASDKLGVDMEGAVTKSTHQETFAERPTTDGPFNELDDHPKSDSEKKLTGDQTGNFNDKGNLTVDKDLNTKDDQTSGENHKISKRRASLPAKHDDLGTGLPSAIKVPSYMAATESAKAKVRRQASPRFGQDGYEKDGLTRRYSLPSSTNAKLSSSPRVQRLVASGRGGIKIDRSLSSSRDGKIENSVFQKS